MASRIEANHGVLPLAEQMQVFSRTDAAPMLGEMIPLALAAAITSEAGKRST